MASITVDIWADIACPWCYIGKRRFDNALAQFDAKDAVEVTLHSFEIAPDTPADFVGTETEFLVAHKGMDSEQVRAMLEQVTMVAAEEGLEYDFDSVQHANTNLAHQLVHFARSQGQQVAVVEELFSSYFEKGRRLTGIEDLVALAGEAGLDGEGARAALETGVYAASVEDDIAQAQAYGITAVPFFVFNHKYAVAGAQDSRALLDVLHQVHSGDLDAGTSSE